MPHVMNSRDHWNIFISAYEKTSVTSDYLGRSLFKDAPQACRRPVVSEYLHQTGFRPHYPDNHPFAVCISHDVDHLYNNKLTRNERTRAATKDFLKGNWGRVIRYMDRNNPINPNYNLEEILTLENRKQIHSSFYFLSLQKQEQDFNYELEAIKPLFAKIRQAGSEIALHGGHEAFNDKEKMQSEKKHLEGNCEWPVVGYRNHFLRFNTPATWRNLEQGGFAYDTTYGFPDHPGYRNGMCYPFFPYDVSDDRHVNVLEIPLIAMDATFIYYLKWDGTRTCNYIKQMIDDVSKVNGVFTLLWHNNYLFRPWNRVFTSILEYCKNQGAWFPSGAELDSWWRKNDFCAQYPRYGLNKPK